MKFVLFRIEKSYPVHDERELKKLVDIDKIFAFRESGTSIERTITLETHNGFMFKFNKIEYENKVYDCYNLNDVLHALKSIEKKMEKDKQ